MRYGYATLGQFNPYDLSPRHQREADARAERETELHEIAAKIRDALLAARDTIAHYADALDDQYPVAGWDLADALAQLDELIPPAGAELGQEIDAILDHEADRGEFDVERATSLDQELLARLEQESL